ncbi:vanillate O-demethylase ferredoxin subunit [Faunimonas pinastri]|uniref:Vanillate O-demethylase ferredoxin subunit n=1 Tax=Faunimonas pinastri TaxID=1855383 RepID=A0A1H9ENI9_9HYPH|nr:PDR/VanB family oxidoreductase [Faunimonas pinastri]SEQ27147.1 vanillate O-demethylase ferredoxin subunit [Faunimonas pinastri]
MIHDANLGSGALTPDPADLSLGLAAERTAAPGASRLTLRVHAIRMVADTIRSVELISPVGGPLPGFTAGAHINIKLPGELSRSYSLTNGPETRDRYVIAVNRDIASRGGSAYVVEKLKVGDLLPVDPPHNTFPLVEDAELSAFFAGGIGITPILSMIRHLEAIGRPWKLFYAARDRASAAFIEELETLEASSRGRVHFHFDAEAGKVMPLLKLAAGVPKVAHVYCCGPARMIDVFRASAGWRPEDNVHVEHFAGTNARPTTAFDVLLKRQGKEFHVPAGQSIMQVLKDNGVSVAYSCCEGVCGTCETVVLEGEPDHKDNVLSPRERASNKVMMICCSGARTGKLVLDI